MEVAEDLKKWDMEDSSRGFPVSQVISNESAIEKALDAEANMEPPTTATVSRTEKTSEPGPPPNGGFAAWLQVTGSFFLFFNGWVSMKGIPNDKALDDFSAELCTLRRS
jgi:hypothetical protein